MSEFLFISLFNSFFNKFIDFSIVFVCFSFDLKKFNSLIIFDFIFIKLFFENFIESFKGDILGYNSNINNFVKHSFEIFSSKISGSDFVFNAFFVILLFLPIFSVLPIFSKYFIII
jgi:hypothetical protein